jgi:hypothetical protein
VTNNELAAQRRAGAAESSENNVIYIGRASFRMEPAHLLEDEVVGATPAPQVELLDHHMDRPNEPPGGHPVGRLAPRTVVDENGWREMRADATRGAAVDTETESDAEAPYLRLRTGEASGLRTPTPLLDDLTDLAIPMPEPPATPPLPLMEIIAGAHLDPADETGVTLLAPEVQSRRRVSLSRPWFASLGVLAFSAGLLTAAAAGVIARPVRVAAAAGSVVVTAPASATAAPATNPVVAAPPAEVVEAPLAVAAAEPPPAGPADAVEAAPATVPARPVTGAKSAAAGNAGAKLRTRGNGAPARGRTRATKSRPEPHGESAIAQDTAVEATAPTESKEAAPAAAASHHRADWVDPFAE